MSERERMIYALITPSGLFEWLRMTFGLKKSPHIYQRLIDNTLYNYMRIGESIDSTATGQSNLTDVFTKGELETDRSPSVLSKKIY